MSTNGSVVNQGTISAWRVGLLGENFANMVGGVISGAFGEVRVTAADELVNEGFIITSDGGDVFLSGKNIDNWGTVKAGNGTEASLGNGGSIYITTYAEGDRQDGHFYNLEDASIRSGTNTTDSGEPGRIRFWGGMFMNHGRLEADADASVSAPVDGGLLRFSRGDALIFADSIEVGGSGAVIHVGSLFLRGNAVTIYGPTDYYLIRTVGDMNFNTTADGAVDFWGVHESRALRSVGAINIFSNNIIEPAEGLNEICDPDPIIFPADTTIVDGSIFCPAVFDSGGMPGTFSLSMQNLSSAPRGLDYSVSSTRGWVTDAMGTTASVPPFQFDFAEISYTIPGGTEIGIEDTVIAILTIDAVFADTAYSRILCIAEGLGIDEFSPRPSDLSLTVSPNPFSSSCQLSQGTIQAPIDGIEIFDLKGNLIWKHNMEELQPRSPITWSPPMSIGSGVYLIKAMSGSKEASTRVIYIK